LGNVVKYAGMKIEIECMEGDFSTAADWPEFPSGELDWQVFIGLGIGDEGLDALRRHHKATRPEISKKEGLTSGHDKFKFRKAGSEEYEAGQILVSGETAIMDTTFE